MQPNRRSHFGTSSSNETYAIGLAKNTRTRLLLNSSRELLKTPYQSSYIENRLGARECVLTGGQENRELVDDAALTFRLAILTIWSVCCIC